MPKRDLCFRSPRYILSTNSGTIYCVVRTKHNSSSVTWYYWSPPAKTWRTPTYASPSESALWLSKPYYQKLDVLPNDVPPCIQKEV